MKIEYRNTEFSKTGGPPGQFAPEVLQFFCSNLEEILHTVYAEIDSRNIVIERRRGRRHHSKEAESDQPSVEEHDAPVIVVDPVH